MCLMGTSSSRDPNKRYDATGQPTPPEKPADQPGNANTPPEKKRPDQDSQPSHESVPKDRWDRAY